MNNLPLIASICGLVAAISWGTADFFAAKASKNASPESAVVWVSIIAAVAFSPIFMFLQGMQAWSVSGIGYAIGAGTFMGLGLLFFYRGLDAGPVSVVSPIGSAYPLVTTLLVLTVLGGSIDRLHLFGIGLVVAGIVAASGFFEAKKSERRLTQGVLYALLTFALWGVAFAFLGQAVNSLGWQKTTFVDLWLELAVILFALMFLKSRKESFKLTFDLASDRYIIATALIQLFGLIIFDFGLTITSSSAVITAISASYPALTVFLALKHLGEKQTVIPLAGAVVTITGVVILSLP